MHPRGSRPTRSLDVIPRPSQTLTRRGGRRNGVSHLNIPASCRLLVRRAGYRHRDVERLSAGGGGVGEGKREGEAARGGRAARATFGSTRATPRGAPLDCIGSFLQQQRARRRALPQETKHQAAIQGRCLQPRRRSVPQAREQAVPLRHASTVPLLPEAPGAVSARRENPSHRGAPAPQAHLSPACSRRSSRRCAPAAAGRWPRAASAAPPRPPRPMAALAASWNPT